MNSAWCMQCKINEPKLFLKKWKSEKWNSIFFRVGVHEMRGARSPAFSCSRKRKAMIWNLNNMWSQAWKRFILILAWHRRSFFIFSFFSFFNFAILEFHMHGMWCEQLKVGSPFVGEIYSLGWCFNLSSKTLRLSKLSSWSLIAFFG